MDSREVKQINIKDQSMGRVNEQEQMLLFKILILAWIQLAGILGHFMKMMQPYLVNIIYIRV